MDMVGRKALVTGGSGGLGRQICMSLAMAGCEVAVGYNEGADRAQGVCEQISEAGGQAFALQLDQSRPNGIEDAVATAVRRLGDLDILINNAAIARGVPFSDLEGLLDSVWDETMTANLRGPWLVSKYAARHLKASGRGRIVNIAAMAGMKPMGASIAQSVSKAGVIQLTRCLAVALAPDVTVNCVAPGLMEGTELTKNMSDAFRDSFTSRAVMGTTTSLADVAGQVVQFCRSDTVTGQTLVVDGGVHFH